MGSSFPVIGIVQTILSTYQNILCIGVSWQLMRQVATMPTCPQIKMPMCPQEEIFDKMAVNFCRLPNWPCRNNYTFVLCNQLFPMKWKWTFPTREDNYTHLKMCCEKWDKKYYLLWIFLNRYSMCKRQITSPVASGHTYWVLNIASWYEKRVKE